MEVLASVAEGSLGTLEDPTRFCQHFGKATDWRTHLHDDTHEVVIADTNRPIRFVFALPSLQKVGVEDSGPCGVMRCSDLG